MNPKVDIFLEEGCGRCEKYRSPACKAIIWNKEISELRRIVLECGLEEEFKWKQPCYTLNGKNVLIVSSLNDYAFIGFFKGSLLNDELGMLIAPGKNSQADRRLTFTEIQKIRDLEAEIKSYIFHAIEIEKSGGQIEYKKSQDPMPIEFEEKLAKDLDYKEAFEALTPGRQRSYLLYFNSAKQSATRISRIDKAKSKVLLGKGWNEY